MTKPQSSPAPDADKNLGIKTFVNGALVSDIVLDTSGPATNTIDYVATGPTGLIATSTRTVPWTRRVPIDCPRLLPIPPTAADATSTAQ